MDLFCRHGHGRVVLTFEGFLLFVVDGRICSSNTPLSTTDRAYLEGHLAAHPPHPGRLTPHQIQASLRVPYDEDDHADDCSLGSEDTWSDVEDEED